MLESDLKRVLIKYVERFNSDDIEYYKQDIDNANAQEWMLENVPYFTCPDKTLEEIYYFRWYIYSSTVMPTTYSI